MPENPISCSVDFDNKIFNISTDYGQYKVKGEDADDFPNLPNLEKASDEFSITAPLLRKGNFLQFVCCKH